MLAFLKVIAAILGGMALFVIIVFVSVWLDMRRHDKNVRETGKP